MVRTIMHDNKKRKRRIQRRRTKRRRRGRRRRIGAITRRPRRITETIKITITRRARRLE